MPAARKTPAAVQPREYTDADTPGADGIVLRAGRQDRTVWQTPDGRLHADQPGGRSAVVARAGGYVPADVAARVNALAGGAR